MMNRSEFYRFFDRGAGNQGTPLNSDELNKRFFDVDGRLSSVEGGQANQQGEAEDAIQRALDQLARMMALLSGGGVPTNGGDNQALMWSGLLYLWRAITIGDISGLQAALDLKASLASPHFSGTINASDATAVRVPNVAQNDNSDKAANTAFVAAKIATLIGSAPGALDTLGELAAALGEDAGMSTTIMGMIAQATTAALGRVALSTDGTMLTGTDTTHAVTPSNVTAKQASKAHFLGNTAGRLLTTDAVNSCGALVTLTDAATIAWDMAQGINATVTLGGNRKLGNPGNTIIGRSGVLVVKQPSSGGPRLLTFDTYWQAQGGIMPVISTAANAKDLIYYWVEAATTVIITGILKGVAAS